MTDDTREFEPRERNYKIGGRQFVQRPLVLQEIIECSEYLADLDFERMLKNISSAPGKINAILREALTEIPKITAKLMAVILKPDGLSAKEAQSHRAETQEFLAWNLEPEELADALDFFMNSGGGKRLLRMLNLEQTLMPIIYKALGIWMAIMEAQASAKQSTASCVPSPGDTPNETPLSDGPSPSNSPSDT